MTIIQFDHHIVHMNCEYNTETKELSYTYAPEYGDPHTTVHTVDQSEIDWMIERGQITSVETIKVQTDSEILHSEIREVEQFISNNLSCNFSDGSDWYKEHEHIINTLTELPCFSDRAVIIYLDYIRPLYVQQDYMNNFLTVNGMAEYYDYPERVIKSLIEQGKHVRDNILN